MMEASERGRGLYMYMAGSTMLPSCPIALPATLCTCIAT
jgi:hypothetical protein